MRNRTSAVTSLIALVVALVMALAAPALAVRPADHGKKSHSNRGAEHSKKAKGSSSSAMTEDNDSNDGGTPNNVADEGDNWHPSGKDRSVENGGSGNQGNSGSAPDEDGHGPERDFGGTDKPDGPGGMDLADQDGNNGCGNDDDFEDDNEGWCGKNPKHDEVAPAGETCAADETMTEGDVTCGDDSEDICVEDTTMEGAETCGEDSVDSPEEDVTIPDEDVEGDTETLAPVSDAPEDYDVLGLVIERGPVEAAKVLGERITKAGGVLAAERAALPFTGGEVLPLLLVGAALMLAGLGVANIRKGER